MHTNHSYIVVVSVVLYNLIVYCVVVKLTKYQQLFGLVFSRDNQAR